MKPFSKYTKRIVFIALIIVALFVASRAVAFPVPSELAALPILAFFSLYRMTAAYILALLFSVVYGYYAATHMKAGKIMIPLLDVMQSVPILGFFPAAVFFLITAFQGSAIGIELAAIFLIFTSQVWNMTFGVYESLTTLPKELKQVAENFGLRRLLFFEKLVFPATIPKLVYNSTISWANGWYFLIASEIISLGSIQHKLPGLGSYLVETTAAGDLGGTFAGLSVLIAIILALDLLIWRPLTVWSEKFRIETSAGAKPTSGVYRFFKWSPTFRTAKQRLTRAMETLFDEIEKFLDGYDAWMKKAWFNKLVKGIAYAALILIGALLFNVVFGLALLVWSIITEPLPPLAYEIPMALMYSFGRLVIAYLISLLWTIPTAIYIASSRSAQKYLIPFFEVAAAIPATALFPIIVLLVIQFTGDLNFAAILLVLTGMQWYLLFNALVGAKNLPSELEDVARAFNVRDWRYYKKFMIPAMLPSLVTGSVIAFGGGWNALFVSEYIAYGGKVYSTPGIGSMLSVATYQLGSMKLIFLTLAIMILFIFLLNHFFWRRLYNFVSRRYKLDY
ncbi:ABC transporter permease subunit [Candidatus Micrarchaeota archaeon]|nr:ABC transporter permease subunit [Candidatus Micrarchaeota archaeon]